LARTLPGISNIPVHDTCKQDYKKAVLSQGKRAMQHCLIPMTFSLLLFYIHNNSLHKSRCKCETIYPTTIPTTTSGFFTPVKANNFLNKFQHNINEPSRIYVPVRLASNASTLAIAWSPLDGGQMIDRHDRPTADFRDIELSSN